MLLVQSSLSRHCPGTGRPLVSEVEHGDERTQSSYRSSRTLPLRQRGVEFDPTEKQQHALNRLTRKSGKWFLSNPRSPRIKGREVSTQRSPKQKSRSCRLSSGHVTCSRTHESIFLFAIRLQKGSTKAAGSRSSLTLHIKQSETSVN